MDKMELKALGKINLGLDVLGRRENGYHDVRMVMQTVYLYDQIRIEKTKKPGIELSTNLFYLPVNENNLAYQAADEALEIFNNYVKDEWLMSNGDNIITLYMS